METLKELWDGVKGQLADRMSNPFTGAFLISWMVWNFRLLVVILWVEPYTDKFQYIDRTLYPTFWHSLWLGVLAPIATAYGYLYFYSWATTRAATFYRKQQSDANNKMREADGAALMTHEEHQDALQKLARAESKWKVDRDDLQDQLSRQQVSNAQLQKSLDEAKQRNAELQNITRSLEAQLKKVSGSSSISRETNGIRLPVGKADKNSIRELIGEVGLPPIDGSEAELVLEHPNKLLPGRVLDATYSRMQIKILELLRNGEAMNPGQLAGECGVEVFELQTTLYLLKSLDLVASRSNGTIVATDEGLILLRSFIDEGKWRLSVEGQQ